MGMNVSVIGAGSMGTAVSILLAGNGHNVKMWSVFKEEVEMINTLREQKDKLPEQLYRQMWFALQTWKRHFHFQMCW